MMMGRTPAFPLTVRAYDDAWRMAAADAGDATPIGQVLVDPAVDGESAQAIADTREHRVRISLGEATGFEPVLADQARAGQAELGRRLFTALHEGSHVTGPAKPANDPHDQVHTLWEEGLASLQARRLIPELLAQSYGVAGAERPAVAGITYGGIAQRIVELFELGGTRLDTPEFDASVRTLAEHVPWADRAGWIAAQMARDKVGAAVPVEKLSELTELIRGQVRRTEPGTGRIGSTLSRLGEPDSFQK